MLPLALVLLRSSSRSATASAYESNESHELSEQASWCANLASWAAHDASRACRCASFLAWRVFSPMKMQPGHTFFWPCVRVQPSHRLHAQVSHFVVAVASHHLHFCWSFGLTLPFWWWLVVLAFVAAPCDALTFLRSGGEGLGTGGGCSARGLWKSAAVVLFDRVSDMFRCLDGFGSMQPCCLEHWEAHMVGNVLGLEHTPCYR